MIGKLAAAMVAGALVMAPAFSADARTVTKVVTKTTHVNHHRPHFKMGLIRHHRVHPNRHVVVKVKTVRRHRG